jgi:hypothetical protein
MKTLKEMKVAMTANEMKHIVGGAEDAINPDLIDDDPANRFKTVSSDCPSPSSKPVDCRTAKGFQLWLGGWANTFGIPVYVPPIIVNNPLYDIKAVS